MDGTVREEKPDFETLYEAYYDKVFKYTYSILLNRENTEDVVSEAFIAAYQNYGRYDPCRSSPATWLTRIAHNMAVNFVKSAAYRRNETMPDSIDAESPEDEFGQIENADVVLRLYRRLTKAQREFLNLRYGMDLTDGEIADLYGIPVKTINKRYQRLLAHCRTILEEE